MLKKKLIDDKILVYLSVLRNYIEMNNENGNFDINRYCEDFLVELLNIVHDLKLINLNEIKVNFPAIDLGDKESRICYQVTSTDEISKIEYTLDKFIEKNLYNEYDELNIFILGEKKNHTKQIERDKIEFSYERNLIDFKSLSVDILNLKNLNKLSDVCDLLEKSLGTYELDASNHSKSKKELLENILLMLEDEIKSNISALYSIINVVDGVKFGFKEILEAISEEKFNTKEFHQPFPIVINTELYDKYENKLIELPTEQVKWVFDLYKQFKLINKNTDLYYFRKDEYNEFRRVILKEMNKYYVKY